ncbi:MAG: hypothetical protein ACREDR_05310 [Blastocatellia bacterium]
MYCPRCGQQANQESNFCGRCGFQFTGLQEAVTQGGLTAPVFATNQTQYNLEARSPRQKGIRFGAKLTFFSLVMLPVAIVFAAMVDGPGPMLLPFIFFLAGVSWMLYSRLFLDSGRIPGFPLGQVPPLNIQGNGPMQRSPLYPAPAPGRWQVDTGEMSPSSVTEHTTNLLDSQ